MNKIELVVTEMKSCQYRPKSIFSVLLISLITLFFDIEIRRPNYVLLDLF